jgi:5'-AMP-activated protein kinase catalytic alpha subunit
MGESDGN